MNKRYDARISIYDTNRGNKLCIISFLHELEESISSSEYVRLVQSPDHRYLYFEECEKGKGIRLNNGKIQIQMENWVNRLEKYNKFVYDVKHELLSGRYYIDLEAGTYSPTTLPCAYGRSKQNPPRSRETHSSQPDPNETWVARYEKMIGSSKTPSEDPKSSSGIDENKCLSSPERAVLSLMICKAIEFIEVGNVGDALDTLRGLNCIIK